MILLVEWREALQHFMPTARSHPPSPEFAKSPLGPIWGSGDFAEFRGGGESAAAPARRDLAHSLAPQKRIASATARSFSIREMRVEAATPQRLDRILSQNGRGAQAFLLHAVHDSRLNMILPTVCDLHTVSVLMKVPEHEAALLFVELRSGGFGSGLLL